MGDSQTRRVVLSALGTLTLGTIGATASHDNHDRKKKDGKKDRKHYDDHCDRCESEKDPRSYINVENVGKCSGRVFVSTTEESFDISLAAGDRDGFHFEGSVRRLDCEDGDLDITIEQRTEDGRNHCSH